MAPASIPLETNRHSGPTQFQVEEQENMSKFIFGPLGHGNKLHNAHRDRIIDKLEPRFNVYARKLRQMYFRDGTIRVQKTFIDPLRLRRTDDTMQNCLKEIVVPGVIGGREEFPDVDAVWPWKVPYQMKRGDHIHTQPFYLHHPETDDEIRVTLTEIENHPKTRLPIFLKLQRYIVGRPNLLNISIVPVQHDKSLHWQAGCEYSQVIENLWVWCFLDVYPGKIEVDCKFLSPNMPIKVGDVEKMLPYGMYLHKKYNSQKFHAIAKLSETNPYVARRNMVIEHSEKIKQQRVKMQAELMVRTEQKKNTRTSVKFVPKHVVSAKVLKKELGKDAKKKGK